MSQVYLKEKDLSFYPNWEKIFGNSNPIFVEIGVGKGDFIVEIAKTNQGANFVGVDYCREILRKAVKKVEQLQLTNVRLLPMEGAKFLCKVFTSETISGVYLNFPDPWVKHKQAKNRLVNQAFTWLLADRLKLNGFFRMSTDYKPYLEETVAFFLNTKAFQPLWDEIIRTDVEDYIPTKYSKKWLSLGFALYFTGFKKIKRVEIPEWVKDYYPLLKITKEDLLPILCTIKLNQLPDFTKLSQNLPKGVLYKEGENVIKVLDIFVKKDGVLLDLLVKEGSVVERFFIRISPYTINGLILSSHEATPPDPLDYVHLAFVLLCKKILEIFPSAEILKTTCKQKLVKEHLFRS